MLTTKNCIYLAQSKTNQKVYIGKTHTMLQERIRNHKADSRKNKSASKFYNHVNKYGWDDIEWSILFFLENQKTPTENEKQLLCDKETEYIDKYNSVDSGLNIMRRSFIKKTNGWRLRNSEYMKKKWQDSNYRQQMSKMLNSNEHREKIRYTRRLTGNAAKPKIKKLFIKKPKNIVYKITSQVTGLLYFGQTTRGLPQTRIMHKKQSYEYTSKFYRHIQQYGIDDLIYEIVYVFPSQDKLTDEEKITLRSIAKEYISKHDTENNGLNTAANDFSESVIKKISQSSLDRWKDSDYRNDMIRKSTGRKNPRKRTGKSYKEKLEDVRLRQFNQRRKNGQKEYKKFTDNEIQPVINMLKSGMRPRHILAKNISKELLNKAQRNLKK